MSKFYENDLSLDTLWRSIVLLGKNNKTYKFALARSIIKLAKEGKTSISMQELAPIFAKITLEHVKSGNQQGVSDSRKGDFLQACDDFVDAKISADELFSITERKAFGDVIERFHNVNNSVIPSRFYDHSAFKSDKKIILQDEIFKLLHGTHGSSLDFEIEARWKLVENAWEQQIDPKLLNVEYDETTKIFYLLKNKYGKTKRVDVTSSREALNGYQKGHCFFCFANVSVSPNDENLCHVDHFFPHTLFDKVDGAVNYNGVWNLVLSCRNCNLSKNARYPALKYLERLSQRNEFYVSSHLPLRESILGTGVSEELRRRFLQARFNEAKTTLISFFEVEEVQSPRF